MGTDVKCMSCGKVENLGYFQLSDMRFDNRNGVTENFSATGRQLYLFRTPAQILEYIIEFHRRI